MKKALLPLFFAVFGPILQAQNDRPPDLEDMPVSIEERKAEQPIVPKNLPKNKPSRFRSPQGLIGYAMNDSILVQPEYTEMDPKYSDFMLAKRRGYWGAINRKGADVLPFEFSDLRLLKTGVFMAEKTGVWGLISPENRELVPLEFRTIIQIGDTLLVFCKPNKQLAVRILNPHEIQVLGNFDYEYFEVLERKSAPVFAARRAGKMGLVDLQNRVLLPFEHDKILWLRGNVVCFGTGKSFYGLVNLQNRVLVPARYRAINTTENPNIFHVTNERWKIGLMDSTGRVLFPLQFDYCWLLENTGFVKTKIMNSQWALWEIGGRQLTGAVYEDISGLKSEAAEGRAKNLGLPPGVRLIASAQRPGGQSVFLDDTGKEYTAKN